MWQDVRYALRQIRKSPGFTATVVITLALGIGANTAIFQLFDAILLQHLPIHDPNELSEIRIIGGNRGFGISNGEYAQLTRPIWRQIQQHHQPFSGVFAWATQDQRVGQGSDSVPVKALEVSGEFFPVLGIRAWRGRLFRPEDETQQCTITQVAVSYPYWQNQMGGRELTGNETLLVEGNAVQVVGVTPPGFFGLAVGDSFDIVFPFCREKESQREMFDVSVMGRLKPGWSLSHASAAMNALSSGIFEATLPAGYTAQALEHFKQYQLEVVPAGGGVSMLRQQYNSSLSLLLVITGLVLLIACANLSNLLLARATSRSREFAVRLAMGASRVRFLWQSLISSGLLALLGTASGIALAEILSRILVRSLSTTNNAISLPTGIDWRVLLFASAVAGTTCIAFGIAPALRSMSSEPLEAMRTRSATSSRRERFSAQRVLVVAQVSISLVLLLGALLFIRSFGKLMTIDPGMRERGITLGLLGFANSHIPPGHFEDFKRELLDEVKSVPGVIDAATTTNPPLVGGSWTHGVQMGSVENSSKFTWVSSDYFRTMEIPLQAGRGFTANDTASSPRVAIVNQAFIRTFLGGKNPIGKTMRTLPEPDYPSTFYEIVGVIPDTKYNDVRGGTPPMTFAPAAQFPAFHPWTQLVIYSNAAVSVEIKKKLALTHPDVVADFSDFQQAIRDGFVRERLLAVLSSFFGFLAALLAMVGLYGVISYYVVQRNSEIGIRVALGADRWRIIAMVMREAATLLFAGLGLGTLLALIAGQSAKSLLFELAPQDPLTLAATIALLTAIAMLASFVPSRRAAKVDPMIALRCE